MLLQAFFVRDRQIPAAFGAAAGQNPAAIFCTHALTETVFVSSFSS